MTDQIPEIEVQSTRRSLMERVSVVWLVPIAALAIALGVAWQTYADQGPVIQVYFDDAAGIHAGETELRYRDVTVGLVEDVRFTENLDQVAVEIRLDKDMADYVNEDAQFWVVTPEVTAQGITGLDTVLSGVYIQGLWDTTPGPMAHEFEGQSAAPLLAGGEDGLRIRLRSTADSLSGNTPIVYKGVTVGQVGRAEVSLDGFSVEADAVVFAPYDALITEATRFWDTSGISFSFGAGGASVNFDSIASLIVGGLTFDTFVSGASLAQDGQEFDVFGGVDAARGSIFAVAEGQPLLLTAVFDGNVSGLSIGAGVEIDGLRIGEVQNLNGVVDRDETGAEQVRLQAVLSIRPERLGFDGPSAADAALTYLEAQVSSGLRARLTTGNLLTGGLKVQLVSRPEDPPAAIQLHYPPYPRIPATASEITDVSATAQDALDRINALPIEELLDSARGFLDNASVLIGNEEMQRLPEDLRGIMADIRAVTSAEQTQAIPDQIAGLITELETTAEEINRILTQFDEQAVVDSVVAVVDQASGLIGRADAALAGVPELIDEITAVAANAAELSLDALVAEVTTLAEQTRLVIADEVIQTLPARIGTLATEVEATVAEARSLIAGINEDGGAERLLAAVDAAGAAAATFEAALTDVPSLIDQVTVLAATANELPLDDLVAQVGALASSTDALIADANAQGLTGQISTLTTELSTAVAEARALIAGINQDGGPERLIAAVEAAGAAATSFQVAMTDVPALIDQVTVLAATANDLPLTDLVTQVTALATSTDALIADVNAQGLTGEIGTLTGELSTAVAEARALISGINQDGGPERLLSAVDAAGEAAASLNTALEGVPGLVARVDAIAQNAETLDLQSLVDRMNTLVDSANSVLDSDDTRALPGELNSALAELSAVLTELRAGGAVDNTNAALSSVRTAADELAASLDGLPGMIDRANAFLAEATSAAQGVGENSNVIRDLRAALREVSNAAEGVSQLARTLERRPNSLILGR